MIAILLLSSGAALCVSLVLFFILRLTGDSNGGAKPAGRRSAPRVASDKIARDAGPAQTARLTASGPDAPTKLSAAERDEMLEGVKNLAENDPQKVAGLIRNWMNEDERPPQS
ncbi:MAG: hypothetical protein NXI24_07190 [bacterium]|nr:hypothetical protein [bacterium]